MTRPRHSTPPPEALAAARLTEFVRTRKVSVEDWELEARHAPGVGSGDCQVCRVRWPCPEYLALAERLGWPGA